MTIWQKIKNVLLAVSMIIIGVAMLFFGEKAYMAIIGLFSLALELWGFGCLFFILVWLVTWWAGEISCFVESFSLILDYLRAL